MILFTFKNKPKKQINLSEWHSWFAWRPVLAEQEGSEDKVLVWLETIERRLWFHWVCDYDAYYRRKLPVQKLPFPSSPPMRPSQRPVAPKIDVRVTTTRLLTSYTPCPFFRPSVSYGGSFFTLDAAIEDFESKWGRHFPWQGQAPMCRVSL